MLAGKEASIEWPDPISVDLRERVVAEVAPRETFESCRDRSGECCQRGEMVAAVPRDRERGSQEDGWHPASLTGR